MPFDTATYPLIRGTTFKQNGQFRNKELLYEKYLIVTRNRKRERGSEWKSKRDTILLILLFLNLRISKISKNIEFHFYMYQFLFERRKMLYVHFRTLDRLHFWPALKKNMIYKSQWSSPDYNNHIFYADRNGSTLWVVTLFCYFIFQNETVIYLYVHSFITFLWIHDFTTIFVWIL